MKGTARVRPTLLVLLWVWVLCVFATLDLFLNVEEFDGVRPRAPLYRSMRYAAHRMVGEPYRENDEFAVARVEEPAPPNPLESLRAELRTVRQAQRKRAFDELCRLASGSRRPEARIAALRGLALLFQERALVPLSDRARDADEDDRVRAAASRYLDRIGEPLRRTPYDPPRVTVDLEALERALAAANESDPSGTLDALAKVDGLAPLLHAFARTLAVEAGGDVSEGDALRNARNLEPAVRAYVAALEQAESKRWVATALSGTGSRGGR